MPSVAVWISYAGDDGGIVCRLKAPAETAEAVFASITHLRFDSVSRSPSSK
jgi:hypothetical protein